MSTSLDPAAALQAFGRFQEAAVGEDWSRTRSLGCQLVPYAPRLAPDGLFNFLFNMAAACHSLYKEFPGGPRDTFGAMIPRPERDVLFLLSALYWNALERLFRDRQEDFKDRDRAHRAIREFRSLFMYKLGGLVGAPADRKQLFLRAIDAIGTAEAELLKAEIDEAKEFAASH